MKHPSMVNNAGEGCRYLQEPDGGPPTCPIRVEWEEGVAIPERAPVRYWKTQCKGFPQLTHDGVPLSDADCLLLQTHLQELGCSFRVVRDV